MTPAGAGGVTTVTVTPRAAADAYQRTENRAAGGGGESFGTALGRAMDETIAQGHAADQQAQAAISGSGNITEVVTALARAELTLQSATAIRDRMVQAYQEVIRMSI